MNTKAITFIFLSALAILNLGTVRKAEDPIRDTQTNPILYEQKKEEEKEGKKGPLLYNVKNNPREAFFIDPPYEKDGKSSTEDAMTEVAKEPVGTEGWWEESAESPQSSSEETSEGQSVADSGAKEKHVPDSDDENASSGPSKDYWW